MPQDCIVWFGDASFSVMKAETLYTAAAWSLAHFISHGFMRRSAVADAVLTVQAHRNTYRVRARDIHDWMHDWSGDLQAVMTKRMIVGAMNSRL